MPEMIISKVKMPNADIYNIRDAGAVRKVASTDNAITRFDGTTGEVQNSSLIIEDNGDLKVGRYTHNVLHAQTAGTPVETVIHTKIKYASGAYMPVIRIYGYAYGLQSPIEFKVGFYIYSGNMGWCGAVSMGAWQPEIYLFKDTVDENGTAVDYIALGLKGSCYYLGFDVDVQFPTSAYSTGYISTTGWTVEFNTDSSTTIIPTEGIDVNVNNGICRKVDYKSTLKNLTINGTIYNGTVARTFNLVNNVLTTKGDIIYASANGTPGTPARLPLGANRAVLTSNTTTGLPEWNSNYVTTDTEQTISGRKTFTNSRLNIQSETHFSADGSPTDYAYGQAVGIFGKSMMVNRLYGPQFAYRTSAMNTAGTSATIWGLPEITSGKESVLAKNPMTAVGDIIYASATNSDNIGKRNNTALTVGTEERLPIGNQGDILRVDSGLPSWGTLNGNELTSTNATNGQVLTADGNGGTSWQTPATYMSNPMTTAGDMIYGSAAGAPTRLEGASTSNQFLTYDTTNNLPAWSNIQGTQIKSVVNSSDVASGYVLATDGSGNASWQDLIPHTYLSNAQVVAGGNGASIQPNNALQITKLSNGSSSTITFEQLYPKIQSFVSGADLNTFNTAGIWYTVSSAVIAAMVNKPTFLAGSAITSGECMMEVRPLGSSKYTCQIFTWKASTDQAIWVRVQSNGTWGSWRIQPVVAGTSNTTSLVSISNDGKYIYKTSYTPASFAAANHTHSDYVTLDTAQEITGQKDFTVKPRYKTVVDGTTTYSTFITENDVGAAALSNDYDDLDNKPSFGTLDTTVTTSLTPSASESFHDNIQLHKISKTGDYNDLLNKPIFWAIYGTTTGEEITAALAAGQYVAVHYNPNNSTDTIYGNCVLHNGESRYYFETFYGSYTRLYATCSKTGATWANGTKAFIGDVRIGTAATTADSTSVISSGTAYILTNSAYNASTNKIATMSDITSNVGTLDTTATTAQETSASESFSGNITLHQVAKTGNADSTDNYHFHTFGYSYKGKAVVDFRRKAKGTITMAERNALTADNTVTGDIYIISDDNNNEYCAVVRNGTVSWTKLTAPYKDYTTLEDNNDNIYLKVTSQDTYATSFVDFLISGQYDNVQGSTEIREYCRKQNMYYANGVNYNGNKLTGIFQPSANTNLWYLRFSKHIGTYIATPYTYIGSLQVYMNQNIISAELIQPSSPEYATVSHYGYFTTPAFGIASSGGDNREVFQTINGVTVGSAPKFTDANVLQSPAGANQSYNILFKQTNNNSAETAAVKFDNDGTFTYNPSSNILSVTNISVTTLNSTTIGTNPKFTDTTYDLGTVDNLLKGEVTLTPSSGTVDTIYLEGAGGTSVTSAVSGSKVTISSTVVNDGTLTINRLGNSLGTFTANQGTATAVDVTDLFYCTYSATAQGTTVTEIDAAIAANKIPVCWYNNHLFVYSGLNGNFRYFGYCTNHQAYIVRVVDGATLSQGSSLVANTWSYDYDSFEFQYYKRRSTKGWGGGDPANVSDNYYPSEKLTYETIQQVREIAENRKQTYVVSDTVMTEFDSPSDDITISRTITTVTENVSLDSLQIGDTFYVTQTEVPDRWVSYLNSDSLVPTTYQEVEYVQGDGSAYIDLQYAIKANDEIFLDVEPLESGVDKSFFGAYQGSGQSCECSQINATYRLNVADTSIPLNVNTKTSFHRKTDGYWYAETAAGAEYNQLARQTTTMTTNACLFGRRYNSVDKVGKCKIYKFSITGVMNLIPCYRKSDSVAGFYDTIGERFLVKSGSGTFTAGPNVVQPTTIMSVTLSKLETVSGVPVTDVEVNGTSVVSDSVAEISIKTLKTDNTTAQTANATEDIAGTGTINLHKVSKTGSYNDLLNKPTIPTVNDATLTIQKNGTQVAQFTANSSSNVTANITVPTQTSDLTDDVNWVKVHPINAIYHNNSTWNLYLPSSHTATDYVRITIPDTSLTAWTMLYFEVSIMQQYSTGACGKLYFFAMHDSTTGDWITSYLKGTIAGNLSTSIKLYGSDRKYLYITGISGYGSVSIDKVMCGDTIVDRDISGITLDTVTALPATYQTGTIYGAGSQLTWDSNGLRLKDSRDDNLTTLSNSTIASQLQSSLSINWNQLTNLPTLVGGANFDSSYTPTLNGSIVDNNGIAHVPADLQHYVNTTTKFANGPGTSVANHVVTFTNTDGLTLKDSGFTIASNVPSGAVFTDTKNTAGTTDLNGTKLYLVGAETQGDNPQTYSNSNCYIGTDNKLYSGGKRVLNTDDSPDLSNFVTKNTAQTITANKTFGTASTAANVIVNNGALVLDGTAGSISSTTSSIKFVNGATEYHKIIANQSGILFSAAGNNYGFYSTGFTPTASNTLDLGRSTGTAGRWNNIHMAGSLIKYNGTTGYTQALQNKAGTIALTSDITLANLSDANDLKAIEPLTGTGLLKRTGEHTWALDSTSYATTSDIPEKTSDLTNDGEDGVNPFVDELDIQWDPTVDRLTTVALGGLAKGTNLKGKTLREILTQILCPYVKFTFSSFSTTVAAGTYEWGASKVLSKFKPVFTLGSEPLTAVKLGTTSGGSDLYNNTNPTSITSNTDITLASSYTIPSTTASTKIYCTFADGEGSAHETTLNVTFSFVKYYYYTVTSSTTIPTTATAIGSSSVKDSISTQNGQYIWFLSPTAKTKIQQWALGQWNDVVTIAAGTTTFTTQTGQQLTYYAYRTPELTATSANKYQLV